MTNSNWNLLFAVFVYASAGLLAVAAAAKGVRALLDVQTSIQDSRRSIAVRCPVCSTWLYDFNQVELQRDQFLFVHDMTLTVQNESGTIGPFDTLWTCGCCGESSAVLFGPGPHMHVAKARCTAREVERIRKHMRGINEQREEKLARPVGNVREGPVSAEEDK